MSIEQWVVFALLVLLPLLEGVTRFRRARANNGDGNSVGEARTSPRALPLPRQDADHATVPTTKPVVSPEGAHTQTGKPASGDAVVHWLRPVRNLRRAIVMATILGPRPQ